MTLDEARAATLARPEDSLEVACAHASYEAVLTIQHAGTSDEERATMIAAFAAAKRSLLVDLADVALVRGEGFPPHTERFARAGYNLPELLGHNL